MARPGIMLYFDMLGPIRVLPDEDKGRLLVAMLEYGKDGVVPEFDGMLALAWEFVKPKIDKDEDNYENSRNQKAFAAFCRKRYRLKLPKISFEEWLDMDDEERQRSITADNETQRSITADASRYPTTVTSTPTSSTAPTTAPTPTPTITPTSTAAAAATFTNDIYTEDGGDGPESRVSVLGGELGKGVVFISQEQMDDLLDKMDIDTFDYYVDKLSAFIIKNDAHVKNHYETILRWWREDGAVRG